MKRKGLTNLLPLALGFITLSAGVAMMFILPDYIIGIFNTSFRTMGGECRTLNATPAQCADQTVTSCCWIYQWEYNSQQNVSTLRSLAMAVIIIAIVWIIIAVISGTKGGNM